MLLYSFQSRLLYFPNVPSRAVTLTPERIGLAFEDVTFSTEDGVRLHGWFVPAASRERGVLLFFHGNAGNISHRLDSIKIFHDLGLSVFIFDYRGYGRSEGKISEQGTYRDAGAAWRYLIEDRSISKQDITLFGRSLGAAIAANLAGRRKPKALIMESSFTSVPDLAAQYYWIFPVRWLSQFRYDARKYLKDVRVPVLVIHSLDDEIIPITHGRKVFAAVNEPRQFLAIKGDHNAGFLISGRTYITGLDAFLTEHLRTR